MAPFGVHVADNVLALCPNEEPGREMWRQDLHYRLNVVPIDVPPLRERGDDVAALAAAFDARAADDLIVRRSGDRAQGEDKAQ